MSIPCTPLVHGLKLAIDVPEIRGVEEVYGKLWVWGVLEGLEGSI